MDTLDSPHRHALPYDTPHVVGLRHAVVAERDDVVVHVTDLRAPHREANRRTVKATDDGCTGQRMHDGRARLVGAAGMYLMLEPQQGFFEGDLLDDFQIIWVALHGSLEPGIALIDTEPAVHRASLFQCTTRQTPPAVQDALQHASKQVQLATDRTGN